MPLSLLRRLWFVSLVCVFTIATDVAAERLPADSFNSDGVEIYYRDYDSALNWRATVPHLDREFRVITMDVRGHGKSGSPVKIDSDPSSITLDVVRLMDHLEIDRAHVGGFSMGGLITLHLAANHPKRLLSAIVGGHGLVPKELLEAGTRHLEATLKTALETDTSVAELLARQAAQLDPGLLRYEPLREFYADLESVNIDPEALLEVQQSLKKLTITPDQAAAIEVPMLAITGDREPAYESVISLRAANPGYTSVAIIPDYGHTNGFLSPTFNTIVRDFLLANSSIAEPD